uniref:Uncharacterized protein n=1 Tax=Siphoviridae sp. ctXBp18 TaxID=2825541 RepID=A0A8S5PJR0_9CAUD|nr:MAG TPA: hypothetical protein [Siphoviridae sp. ctXBp18]
MNTLSLCDGHGGRVTPKRGFCTSHPSLLIFLAERGVSCYTAKIT